MLASWATSRADIMWFHLLQLERCPVQYDQFKRAPTLVTAQRGKDGPGDKATQHVPHDDVPTIGFIVGFRGIPPKQRAPYLPARRGRKERSRLTRFL